MTNKDDCIFCKLVRAELPSYKVYEDDRTLTFMDINPVTDGHTLVVTKDHFDNMFEATAESLQAVAANAKKTANAIRTVLNPAGLMVFQLNGAAAGQTVFHYHLHLLPRWANQPLVLHTREAGNPARLTELAEKIAAALK